MPMVTYTMENGRTTRPMGTESITTRMAPAMKDIGSRINNMVMVKRSGPIMLVTRVSTAMERNMEEANSCGLTDRCTPVSSSRTTFTAMVFTLGRMVANTTVNGRTTKWTVKESSLGLTGENM